MVQSFALSGSPVSFRKHCLIVAAGAALQGLDALKEDRSLEMMLQEILPEFVQRLPCEVRVASAFICSSHAASQEVNKVHDCNIHVFACYV